MAYLYAFKGAPGLGKRTKRRIHALESSDAHFMTIALQYQGYGYRIDLNKLKKIGVDFGQLWGCLYY